MDDEMIERCTKAILDTMDLTDALDGTAAKTYAEACIEALREPTEKMIDAGNLVHMSNRLPDVHWKIMIDSIIK